MILSVKRNFLIRAIAIIVISLFIVQPNQVFANQIVGQEDEIIRRINSIRSEEGLPILNKDNRLMSSALNKAKDMTLNNYFDHSTLSSLKMFYWISGSDYSYELAGENLAKGFFSIDRLINAWVSSPTHYRNIINPKFEDIGIGIIEGELNGKKTVFVVQHFGLEKVSLSYVEQNTLSILNYIYGQKMEINKPIVLGEIDNISTNSSSLPSLDFNVLIMIMMLGIVGYVMRTINSTT